MNNNLNITITIDYITLKMLQDGACLMTSNFNKTHPKHGYVQHDKIFKWDRFLEIAISNEYQKQLEEQKLLEASV